MTGQTVTLLLVEDNDVDIEAVRRGLSSHRIANPLRVARDGVEALELLRSVDDPFPSPFLVLLDLNMPRMNGIEFLAEIRRDPRLRGTVVFVLTTSNAEEDKVEAYDLNVAGYILKSEVGDGFVKLVAMLDRYWRIVEMPPSKTE